MPDDVPAAVRFWKWFRRIFRWCRITVLLVVLGAVCGFIYLNRVGLPEFMKQPLLAGLQARGVDLKFQRIRFRWYRGIVAERVIVGQSNHPDSPRLTADEITLRLDDEALLHWRFDVTGLLVSKGRLELPLNSTNEPPDDLVVEGIRTDLRFLPGDRWELNQLEAETLGLHFQASGALANASHLRKRREEKKEPSTPGSGQYLWRHQVRQVKSVLQQLHFRDAPQIRLVVHGDADDPQFLSGSLQLDARGVHSRWGDAEVVSLDAPLNANASTNGLLTSELRLKLDGAQTPWASARSARLALVLTTLGTNYLPQSVGWDVRLQDASAPWTQLQSSQLSMTGLATHVTGPGMMYDTEVRLTSPGVKSQVASARDVQLQVRAHHSLTGAPPEKAEVQLSAHAVEYARVKAADLQLELHSQAVTPVPVASTNDWSGWAKLVPFALDWNLTGHGVALTNLTLTSLETQGHWLAPDLVIDKLNTTLPAGSLISSAHYQTANRRLTVEASSQIDWRQLAPLFGTNAQRVLHNLVWDKPPELVVSAGMTLPVRTNKAALTWQQQLAPLEARIALDTGPVRYQGIEIQGLSTLVQFTNLNVTVPRLQITRPDGITKLTLATDLRTNQFLATVQGAVNPLAALPMIRQPKTRKVFEDLKFTVAPQVNAEISGAWNDLRQLKAHGTVALTNAYYRGNLASNLTTSVSYANQRVIFTNLLYRDGDRQMTLEGAGLDLVHERIYLTNGVGNVDPMKVTAFIGPITQRAIEPYHFDTPPTSRVYGSLPFRSEHDTDLHFEVEGGPFTYWRFHLPQVAAQVHWVSNYLTITNITGKFHEGRVTGAMEFHFKPDASADYHFHTIVSEANMHTLLSDLTLQSNKLEGIVYADLTVTQANTHDWGGWQGYGMAQMRDGFLWDIPMVGMFTPALDSLSPGLGKARISEGKMTFTITNSVVRTEDLELKGSSIRLQYVGTSDFEGRVDARVTGDLFRDSNVFSKVFGYVLTPFAKIMEYKVTGTLGHPKMEPLYIPKILLMPFSPFKTLRELFDSDKPKENRDLPAQPPPPPSTGEEPKK